MSLKQAAASRFGLRLTSFAAQCLAVAALSMSTFSVRADDIADVQKLLAAGKNAEALQKADQYLNGKPRDPMMRFLRGISLSQAGRSAEAVTVFTKLTEDYPELPEPFNNLAVLYAQQGQYDKARNALEMAIRTNPSYATAYENLGDVYAKLASQAYSKALQIDTRSAVAPKLAMVRDLFPKERNSIVAAAGGNATQPAPPVAARPAAVTQAPAVVTPPVAVAPAVTPPKPAPAPVVAKVEPKPEPKTEPKADATNAERDVVSAVERWADAWSRKDMNAYYAAYTRDFDGGKGSRKAWEAERRNRIVSKSKISVDVSDIKVDINGDKASVRYRQAYRADSLNINSTKRLEMVRSGGKWLIAKESAGS
jgi:tetratricopeptide (TPR) repeat protein